MLQFPNLAVLDCDLNLDGPEKYLRSSLLPKLTYHYEYIPMKDGKPVEVHDCYDRLLVLLRALRESPTIEWVGVDSLTLINEYIIRKILKDQSKAEMEARHWMTFKSHMFKILVSEIRGMGKNVIITCHESIKTKPAGPNKMMEEIIVGFEPSVQGKIADFLGGFFTDVWRCTSEAAPGGKNVFSLWTQRTTQSDLKNSGMMPSPILNPTYETIKQYL